MSTHTEQLGRILATLEIPATPAQLDQLAAYAELILHWNRKVNLTGAKSVAAFIDGPLFDALTLLPVFVPNKTFVDIGSGGGLPGIPVQILHPEIHVTLTEPRKLRTNFLQHAVSALELNTTVLGERLERMEPATYGGAVAQAVWGPAEWMQRGVQLIAPGGHLYVLSSSDPASEPIPDGLTIAASQTFTQPSGGKQRFATRLQKSEAPR